jgi:hypothetical protein
MVKATRFLHRLFKRAFPRMAKGRVANIMGETQGLGQILIQPQCAGNGAANLRHLYAVGEPNPEMIAIGRDKNLRLVPQSAKRDGMNNAIPVALKIASGATHLSVGFAMLPPTTMICATGIAGVHRHFPDSRSISCPASDEKIVA